MRPIVDVWPDQTPQISEWEAQREPDTRRCRTSSSAWISAAVKGFRCLASATLGVLRRIFPPPARSFQAFPFLLAIASISQALQSIGQSPKRMLPFRNALAGKPSSARSAGPPGENLPPARAVLRFKARECVVCHRWLSSLNRAMARLWRDFWRSWRSWRDWRDFWNMLERMRPQLTYPRSKNGLLELMLTGIAYTCPTPSPSRPSC